MKTPITDNAEQVIDAALHYIADLNGCDWFKTDYASQDMKQRAKSIHKKLADFKYRNAMRDTGLQTK